MDESNAKLNSRKGKKAEAKARAPKVEQNRNIEARVVESLVCKRTKLKLKSGEGVTRSLKFDSC